MLRLHSYPQHANGVENSDRYRCRTAMCHMGKVGRRFLRHPAVRCSPLRHQPLAIGAQRPVRTDVAVERLPGDTEIGGVMRYQDITLEPIGSD